MLVMLLTPTSKVREHGVNVEKLPTTPLVPAPLGLEPNIDNNHQQTWLARPWASENVGIRQRAGDIEAHIVVRGFPHYIIYHAIKQRIYQLVSCDQSTYLSAVCHAINIYSRS